MRKIQIVLVSALVLILALSFVACNEKEPEIDAVLDANFIVDTTAQEVNFGESINIDPISAKDGNGQWRDATIEITDPNGNTTAVEAGSYTPQYLGVYKLTYKIDSLTREIVITVKDSGIPEISGMSADSLVLPGEIIDLSKIVVTDKIDGQLTPQITVKFGTEDVVVTDNKFVAEKSGCYVINVKAKDAAGNELDENLNVFTVIDYEQGVLQTSEFFPMSISDKFDGYRPGHVAKAEWFENTISWLNDFCLLGSKTQFLSDAQYLSFWTYFDGTENDLNQLLLIGKYTYYYTTIFTEYGQKLDYYWQGVLNDDAPEELKEMYKDSEGKFTYQLETNKWYRVVIDLTKLTNASKYGTCGSPIEGAKEASANPKGFADIPFGFGTWDQKIGKEATKAVATYIDDIRLTNTLDDETYRKEIKVNVTSEASVTKKANETFTISYNVENVENGKVTFESTNEEVATVDENGVVTCVAEGQAKIVLTSVNDNRKIAEVAVTVAAAGAKVRDENHQVIFTGGSSVGDWETEGKYNMQEHMTWACNDTDNGVCHHCNLVDFSLCHGTVADYEALTVDGSNLVGGNVSVQGWRAEVGGTNGLLFVFTAKTDVAIKTTGHAGEGKLGGWVSDTKWEWVKVKADGTTETLKEKQAPGFADVESDWFELAEGETFILLVRSIPDDDVRNFEYLPYVYVCPMIEAQA